MTVNHLRGCQFRVIKLFRGMRQTEQLEDTGCKSEPSREKKKENVGINDDKVRQGEATGKGFFSLFILTVGNIGDTHSFY